MTVLFFLIAALAVASGLGVVAFKNPIFSALSLVGNLLAIAVCFAMLDAHFLAAVQVIVYAGAIMVLVLFMLMLLNLKVEKHTRKSAFMTVAAVACAAFFLMLAAPVIQQAWEHHSFGGLQTPPLEGTVQGMGLRLYREYGFLFQASGILLMTAIVGAVMLAKRTYRR